MIDANLTKLIVFSGCRTPLPRISTAQSLLIQNQITQTVLNSIPDELRDHLPAIFQVASSDNYSFSGNFFDAKKGEITLRDADSGRFFPERIKFRDDDSFMSRIELITALFHSSVLSASFVPTAPSQEQTVYMSTAFIKEKVKYDWVPKLLAFQSSEIEEDIGDLSLLVNPESNRQSKTKLKGFIAPYDGFSLKRYETDRDYTATKISVNAEESSPETITNHIGNTALQERMRDIWKLFKADVHSKELALTLIDKSGEGKILRVHLVKG